MGKEEYSKRLKCDECGEPIGWHNGIVESNGGIRTEYCCDRCRWTKD